VEPVDQHAYAADASFDGGDLDCGNGLLLLIRQHMDRRARRATPRPSSTSPVAS
jgi:hypothetical protein